MKILLEFDKILTNFPEWRWIRERAGGTENGEARGPEVAPRSAGPRLVEVRGPGCMGLDTITLSGARSRLDQRRFSRPNTHFAAVFKILKTITFSQANLQNFC